MQCLSVCPCVPSITATLSHAPPIGRSSGRLWPESCGCTSFTLPCPCHIGASDMGNLGAPGRDTLPATLRPAVKAGRLTCAPALSCSPEPCGLCTPVSSHPIPPPGAAGSHRCTCFLLFSWRERRTRPLSWTWAVGPQPLPSSHPPASPTPASRSGVHAAAGPQSDTGPQGPSRSPLWLLCVHVGGPCPAWPRCRQRHLWWLLQPKRGWGAPARAGRWGRQDAPRTAPLENPA